AVTAFLGLRQPTLYTASALVEVGRVWKEPLEDTYAATEAVNSAGFIQRLADRTGVRAGLLRRSIRAETVTAGPPRIRYPILVRITATTGSFDESVRLASAAADALIEDHARLFEEALAPRIERQHRLEAMLKAQPPAPSPAEREIAMKLHTELDEVKSNNTSPTVTEKTHLIEPVVPGEARAPTIWRNTAVSACLALLGAVAAVILFEMARPGGASKSRAVTLD
ncbi:MAG TPA: hypothetical protein VNO14_16965, partial [Blastocatellia bacterium]|nr:hypothetical protein [Blastocatellia bacterium]